MPNTTCRASSRSVPWFVALFCALTWATDALAETAIETAPAASAPNVEAAFGEAVKRFKSGDSEHALPLFIYLSKVTDSPNVHLYVGYCQQELGRDRDAHQAFSLAVKQALQLGEARYDATREAAQAQLGKLELRLARLTISLVQAPPEFVVKLDDQAIDPSLLGSPLMVDPGLHHVEAEAEGANPISRKVVLGKGGSETVMLLFEKRSEQSAASLSQGPPHPDTRSGSQLTTFGLVAAGVGVVGLGAFTVAGLLTRSAYDRLQADCPNGCSDAAHRGDLSHGRSLQMVANIGLAAGIVGTVTGATLLYLGLSNGKAARPSLELAPGLAKISYQGSF